MNLVLQAINDQSVEIANLIDNKTGDLYEQFLLGEIESDELDTKLRELSKKLARLIEELK